MCDGHCMMTRNDTFAPDFFIVGAAKAGTTAVYSWLTHHPDVFLPKTKEPGFFAFSHKSPKPANGPYDPNYVRDIATDCNAYKALYADADNSVTGDASPVYLGDLDAARRIAKARPDARIVILLRDPVERAFSQYKHHRRDNLEPCTSFEDALNQEDHRTDEGWSWGHQYAGLGHYAEPISRFLKEFDRNQILFLEFARLQSDPDGCWRDVCQHLHIQTLPLHHNDRVNETHALVETSARPKLSHALQHPGRVQSLAKSLMPKAVRTAIRTRLEGKRVPILELKDATRAALSERFRSEHRLVERLSGLDLKHWSSSPLPRERTSSASLRLVRTQAAAS